MSPSARRDDEGIIDLRTKDDEPEFTINRVPDDREPGKLPQPIALHGTPLSEGEMAAMKPYDNKVKIKFDKFVNLIATHAYEEIFENHLDEDVIVSTDLLADLANAHEEKEGNKKIPIFFFIGILLGVVIAWILLRTSA